MRKVFFGLLAVTVIMMIGCNKEKVTEEVTAIELDAIQASVLPTQTMQLKAATTPENCDVVWTSGNTEVATVDENGIVTAKTKGVTNIIAASKDGNVKASCEVTVDGTLQTTIFMNKQCLQCVDVKYEQTLPSSETKQHVINVEDCQELTEQEKIEIYNKITDSLVAADVVAFRMSNDICETGTYSSKFLSFRLKAGLEFHADDPRMNIFVMDEVSFRGFTFPNVSCYVKRIQAEHFGEAVKNAWESISIYDPINLPINAFEKY